MSDFKPRPGTFLPYLEAARKEKSARPGPLTLLEILSGQPQQALPLFDLQTRSGMEPSPYGESLKRLRDAGCITIEGKVLDETVRLTGSGVELARLARPA
jgi:hypothetical protein